MSFKRKLKRHKPWNPRKPKPYDWIIPESIAKPALEKWTEETIALQTGQEMANTPVR